MNRFLKAICLIALITFFASCKKDDDNVAPPRDYGVQYASDKDSIEKYLKNHYIADTSIDNIRFAPITEPATQVSIWDQTLYPLQSKIVKSINTKNTVDYKVYYLNLRQGTGDKPTRADNILIAYRGWLLNDTQFDYQPYPTAQTSLDGLIEGWKGIIPLFNAGTYTDIPDNPNPADFEGYGAGVMFVPSGLAYYNTGSGSIGAYKPIIFSFSLYAVTYTDIDGDGILNKDEIEFNADGSRIEMDIQSVDTDGDEIPNYLDADDDGDGFSTKLESRIPSNDANLPAQYYTIDQIPACTGGSKKKHLDPNCG